VNAAAEARRKNHWDEHPAPDRAGEQASIISVFIANAQLAFTFKAKLTLKFLTEFFEGFNPVDLFQSKHS